MVAVDGSEPAMRAVDAAVSLTARYNSAVLTALYVIYIPFGERLYPRSAWYNEFLEDINKASREWLAEIQRRGKESGVEIKVKIIETAKPIAVEIAKYAGEDKTELIVVGSRGKSELEKLFLGSVATGVLAYARCPVLVVR